MIKNLLFKKAFLVLSLIFTAISFAQAPITFAYTNGFTPPATLPPGLEFVSYDGATSCNTSPNGKNAVTTLILKVLPGYELELRQLSGTGVRSGAGPSDFSFTVLNNGEVSSPVQEVPSSSNCAGNTALTPFNIPDESRIFASGSLVNMQARRAPGSASGGGYSHIKIFTVIGQIRANRPVATPATNISAAGFTANWLPVPEAVSYRVDVSTSAEFTAGTILPNYTNVAVNGLSLEVTENLVPGTTYYYRVRAVVGVLGSVYSNVIDVPMPQCEGVVPPVAEAQEFCGSATVSQLLTEATGVVKWYSSENAATQLEATAALSTGTYYVSQVITNCESDRVPVAITIKEIPAEPIVDATQDFCGAATVAALQAESTATLLWYADATGGSPLTADTALEAGDYFVSQTVNGCESTRAAVQVTLLSVPAAPVAVAQEFCGSGTVSGLVATGDAIKWYEDEDAAAALAPEAALATGTYYVSQTVNGCESPKAPVAVTLITLPAQPVAAEQQFCGSGTVAALEADGEGVQWYETATAETPLTAETQVHSGTYYVTQTIGDCESTRLAVTVNVYDVPQLPVIAPHTFCGEATVANFEVTTGQQPLFYTAQTGGESLAGTAALQTAIYYVSQTVNGCESARVPFLVLVNPIPTAPVAAAQTFCGNATVATLTASGYNPQWFSSEDADTPLAADTPLVEGTYYVSQNISGCESPRTAVEVTAAVIDQPVGEADQNFGAGATLAGLVVEGDNIVWYANEDLTEVLADDTALTDGVTYYAVTVEGECMSEALAVTAHFSLSTDVVSKTKITIYPNPVSSVLNVNGNESIENITVFNLMGQEELTVAPHAVSAQVNVSALQAATYLVRVQTALGTTTVKMVKK